MVACGLIAGLNTDLMLQGSTMVILCVQYVRPRIKFHHTRTNFQRGLSDQKSGHDPFFDVNCIFIIYLGYWHNLG